MKIFLALVLLVMGLGILVGCGPKDDERSARRIEERNRAIRTDLDGLQDDWQTFWLTDEPSRLSRYDNP
jgi:hypothetical protein